MIKTKKKYLIISLLTVIFTAVICAFTIQSPQAVYAATSSLFSGTPRPNIYANPGAVSIYYPTNFYLLDDATQEKIKSGYLVLMRTESIEKYYKLKNEGFSLTVEDKRGNHTESYAPYALNLISESRIKSALSSYCDDFYFYSSNNNMEGKNIGEYLFDAFNKNVFKFAYPADLSKDYYYYFAYFSFSHDIPFVGNCVEKLTMEELGNFSEKFNVSKSIYSYLEASFGDSYTRIELQKALGIYTGNKAMPITVKYRHCAGYADIREIEKSFTMDSLYGQCKEKAVEAMYNQVEGLNDITSFNCVYEDFKWLSNGDQLDFGDKIILQAKDYTYVYNGSESAVLTVNYEPFNYKDFSIRVTNNDEANNLTLDICSASVIEDSVNYTLKFNYSDMNRWLANKAGWLVDLNEDLFNSDGVIVNKSNKIEVTVGDTDLLIKVAKAEQNSLADLRVCVVAEIVEDKNITYTVHYTKLVVDVNGEITQEDVAMSPTLCLMTVYQQLTNFTNFMNRFGDTVSSAVAPAGLGSVVYYVPSSVSSVSVGDLEYNLNVSYTYRTILRVSENSVFKRFVQLDHYNNQYSLSDLGVVVPDGYRVSNMTSDSFMSIDFDDKVPDKAILTSNVDLFTNKIVDVDVEFSDTILVNLEYLENYVYTDENGNQQASGFAVKKTLYKEVPADFFADVYKPTLEELKAYTGLDNMCIIGTFGAVNTDKISVVKNGSVYNVKVEYHEAFLKVTQSTGESEFMNIPLSNYDDWCNSFDKDWSILALNTKEKVCFKSNADVKREDLFGYFYVAIFKEVVKNLDELFAGYSADGCRSYYTAKEVRGTDLYKFFDSIGIIGAVITCGGSKVYQAVEESFNDDAGTYYSYFVFIDGSSTLPYSSNNKADDYFDNKSAFENTAKDVQETISAWWNSNNDVVKGIKALLGVLLIVGVAICVIYLIPVFAGGIGKASNAITQAKNDTKNKGGTTHKKPVKKYKPHKTKRK